MNVLLRKNTLKKRISWSVIVREVDQKGKRKDSYYSNPDTGKAFETKKQAKDFATELESSINNRAFVKRSEITFEEWLKVYLDTVEIKLKPSTFASYKGKIRVHIVPNLGHIPLQELEGHHLNAFYIELGKSGRKSFAHSRGAGLSPRTIEYIATIIGASLQEGVKQGVLARNVAKFATKPKVQRNPEAIKFWTPAELAIFLEAIEGHPLENLYRFLAFTGCRRGEALYLSERAIDFEKGKVTLSGTVGRVEGKLLVGSNKSERGYRTIEVDRELLKLLDRELEKRASEKKLLGRGYESQNLVFAEPNGGYINPTRATRVFGEIVAKLDLPRITLHGLRHTHCSILLANGSSINYVAKRLGDDPATVMKTYAHILPSEGVEAVEGFLNLLNEAKEKHIRS